MMTGRCWVFDDNINTDVIWPAAAYGLPRAQGLGLVLSAVRPEWAAQVRPGDMIVAGRNFGTGSGRPAARALRELGIAAILAESIAGLFFRTCVNDGIPAMTCPGIRDIVIEGDVIRVDPRSGLVHNLRSAVELHSQPIPAQLLAIIEGGGLIDSLSKRGYVELRKPSIS